LYCISLFQKMTFFNKQYEYKFKFVPKKIKVFTSEYDSKDTKYLKTPFTFSP